MHFICQIQNKYRVYRMIKENKNCSNGNICSDTRWWGAHACNSVATGNLLTFPRGENATRSHSRFCTNFYKEGCSIIIIIIIVNIPFLFFLLLSERLLVEYTHIKLFDMLMRYINNVLVGFTLLLLLF